MWVGLKTQIGERKEWALEGAFKRKGGSTLRRSVDNMYKACCTYFYRYINSLHEHCDSILSVFRYLCLSEIFSFSIVDSFLEYSSGLLTRSSPALDEQLYFRMQISFSQTYRFHFHFTHCRVFTPS